MPVSALYWMPSGVSPSSRRAWIEIDTVFISTPARIRSPSSRRAWIEIQAGLARKLGVTVALLAEGVDRNCTLA